MSNNRYGWREVFDVKFIDSLTGELLFEIDTSIKFLVGATNGDDAMEVIIQDALLDVNALNGFLSGKYDNVTFRLEGRTIVRGQDGVDRDMHFIMPIAKFYNYRVGVDLEGKEYGQPILKLHITRDESTIFNIVKDGK